MNARWPTACFVLAVAAALAAADEPCRPIRTVRIGPNREFRVNGEVFFPIMSWLQEPKRYPKLRGLGINTFCGNHGVSAADMCAAAKAAGGYCIPHFDKAAARHPHLLAWIHGDEPDLGQTVSDAKITPAKSLRLNRRTPLRRIVDGVHTSWSVLDPLAGAEITIHLKAPVTVRSLAVALTISKGLSVAKDVVLLGDGKQIATATLAAKRGRQKIPLPAPATFKDLTFRVVTIDKGEQVWGSIGEIEGFDAAGRNLLLSPPRVVPRKTPQRLAAEFRALKQADATRPVFVTFTSSFMDAPTRYDEATRKRLYPAYVKSCDVVGFDIYPIYGWNKPQWLIRVAEGVGRLREIAGPKRPVYAWIETSKGSQWITYSQQKDVLPKHTRAEVWMAIIRGATAIGYFTHAWRPTFTEFRPTEAMQAELKRLNGQIARLAGAIAAPPAKARPQMELAGGLTCHCRATHHDGAIYLFAQNIDMKDKAAAATIRIEGLAAGKKIEVVGERRSITAAGGKFTDDFPALREHVYRWKAE